MTTGKTLSKSEATRNSLMRAAEKLFAKQGIENVTARSIIDAAGQKNESALQYHFKNRQGLVDAINQFRQAQVDEKRGELLRALLQQNPSPSLREICSVLINPIFLLAKSDTSFRHWLKASSLDFAASAPTTLKQNWSSLGENSQHTGWLLEAKLDHIDPKIFAQRLISIQRIIAITMSAKAKEKNPFRGPDFELFYNVFLDTVVAILTADLSEETLNILNH